MSTVEGTTWYRREWIVRIQWVRIETNINLYVGENPERLSEMNYEYKGVEEHLNF